MRKLYRRGGEGRRGKEEWQEVIERRACTKEDKMIRKRTR